MSIVYQLAEDVKQYEEIEGVISEGGANTMKIKISVGLANEDQSSEGRSA
jgi:hypothetical protein